MHQAGSQRPAAASAVARLLRVLCASTLVLLASLAHAGDAHPPADAAPPTAPTRRIAITFDDLPWANLDPTTPLPAQGTVPPRIAERSQRLMRALKDSGTPAIGFVNCARLLSQGQSRNDRLGMLEAWLEAGMELGNHTSTHVDLHVVGLAAYERDILDCDRTLRPLLAKRDMQPRWFRPPFLRSGRTLDDKAALEALLARHGYRLAPVTVTNSDWIWATAYVRALDAGDLATQAKLRTEYVKYLLRMVNYFEQRSIKLLGYALPQTMLLHANSLNADTYLEFATELRARGYEFVSIDQAMGDTAYLRPDEFTGALGTSWIHRWAMAAGNSWKFHGGQPTSPHWVLGLAGVSADAE